MLVNMNGNYTWNEVYRLVMYVKSDYTLMFNDGETNFKTMLEKLNSDMWNNIFDQVQINQNGRFLLLRYGLHDMGDGMWEKPNSIFRELRSIVIDIERDRIVLCPFKKFFNLDEVQENSLATILDEIDNATIVEYSDKLDGSMQSASWYEDDVFMSGSKALDFNDSWRLVHGKSMLTDNHIEMLKVYQDWTSIFEYISLRDKHVVDYTKEQEGMYLIGMRNNYTGEEKTYDEIVEIANEYGILCTKVEKITIQEILVKMKEYKSHEKEGWVLNIDGHRVKSKCDDYVKLHGILGFMSSVNLILRNMADNTLDDLLSKVPDDYKKRIINVYKVIKDRVNLIECEIESFYLDAPKESTKEFMIWVDTNVEKSLKGYVKAKYLGKSYNLLKRTHEQGYKKLADLGLSFELFQGIMFDESGQRITTVNE